MSMRKASINRKTGETDIRLLLNLDGNGEFEGELPLGFLKHMLATLARHSSIDLSIKAGGDTDVDSHHLTEDIGIALGQALEKALGGKAGIRRYGYALIPMDESLASAAIDISGRAKLVFDAEFESEAAGGMTIGLVRHFFDSLVSNARITAHIKLIYGTDPHHKIEAIFKAFARALGMAVEKDKRLAKIQAKGIPSTKGLL